jgi:hypothetical protein
MFCFAEPVQYNAIMKTQWSILLLAITIVPITLTGCSGDVKLDNKATIMDVDVAKKSRELFDKVQGDYEKLTPEDKAAYLKLHGNDQSKADGTWKLMTNPNARSDQQGT